MIMRTYAMFLDGWTWVYTSESQCAMVRAPSLRLFVLTFANRFRGSWPFHCICMGQYSGSGLFWIHALLIYAGTCVWLPENMVETTLHSGLKKLLEDEALWHDPIGWSNIHMSLSLIGPFMMRGAHSALYFKFLIYQFCFISINLDVLGLQVNMVARLAMEKRTMPLKTWVRFCPGFLFLINRLFADPQHMANACPRCIFTLYRLINTVLDPRA